jgi:peptide/nickel transport system substrate-binding protein
LELVPALAVKWEQPDPKTWRLHLRPNVTFHNGERFTADDVVFSIARIKAEGSDMAYTVATVTNVRKVDDLTVDLVMDKPNPILPLQTTSTYIMSKAWSEANGAAKPASVKNKVENFATNNANGTGAFKIKSRQVGVRTVLVPNEGWWGPREHNLTEVVFTPIQSDATRVAALLSGELDMIYPIPQQDAARVNATGKHAVLTGFELRTIFVNMDQSRDELLESNVKGKNPFKDRRVRQALYQAIDIEAIHKTTMRNLSKPTGALLSAPKMSSPQIEKRLPYDKEAAKKLLAEAGYPNGFEVTLDCPNNRYVNDERICQALAAMWSQVGVATRVNAMPRSLYFPKLERTDTSLYMLGWGGASTDAIFVLQPVLSTYTGKGDGDYNYGRYSNPKLDALAQKAKIEMNGEARLVFIQEALMAHNAEINHLPLHRQVIPWASRGNVTVIHRADNFVTPYWVKM